MYLFSGFVGLSQQNLTASIMHLSENEMGVESVLPTNTRQESTRAMWLHITCIFTMDDKKGKLKYFLVTVIFFFLTDFNYVEVYEIC